MKPKWSYSSGDLYRGSEKVAELFNADGEPYVNNGRSKHPAKRATAGVRADEFGEWLAQLANENSEPKSVTAQRGGQQS